VRNTTLYDSLTWTKKLIVASLI